MDMEKAIQFGAGNIGRGFIGYLLSSSNYEVIFADIDKDIIDAINSEKRYLVEIVGNEEKKEYVENIVGISSMDENLIMEINNASIITTAVGGNALVAIAPVIAKGIKYRYENKNTSFLNIIPCENVFGSADFLKAQVIMHLEPREIEYMNTYIGFVNSVVDRIVPPPRENMENILHVIVEDYSEWIVDRGKFKGEVPEINGMEVAADLDGYVERKLFTLNTGHAITAYLGYLFQHKTIRESILNEKIEEIVVNAMLESGEVLIKRYGFNREKHREYIDKILNRFKNPYLVDEVTRVGRQPLRKLASNDRLIKPLNGTIEYKLENEYLIKGIAGALSYDYSQDEEAVKMQEILKEMGLEKGISYITGLDIRSKEIKLIKNEYLQKQGLRIS